jgi:thiol-disulfide isomerase/thioredoxin
VAVPGATFQELTMRLRWAVAAASASGLAFLTLGAPLRLPFDHADAAAGPGACPANAKRANLNFTLKDLENKEVSLASFKGKVILLDFWATWCGPCKIEIPWFIEFQNKYAASGLQVIGVVTEDTLDKAKPFVKQWKMNYTVLQGLDRDDLDEAYGPMFGLPVTVLISRDGKVCAKHIGVTSKPVFENEIKALL